MLAQLWQTKGQTRDLLFFVYFIYLSIAVPQTTRLLHPPPPVILLLSPRSRCPPPKRRLSVVLVDVAFLLQVGDAGEEGDGLAHRHVAVSEEAELALAVDVLGLRLDQRLPLRVLWNLLGLKILGTNVRNNESSKLSRMSSYQRDYHQHQFFSEEKWMERQHKKNPSDKLTQAEERQINNKINFHVKNLGRHQVACGCKFSNWTAALMDVHALVSF